MTRPPLIYIAGPFSGKTREAVDANKAAAESWGLKVAELGGMPVVPHQNTSHPEYERIQPYSFWIAGTMQLMRVCDAVLMIPGWDKSKGAKGELSEALFIGRRVFYVHPMEWVDGVPEMIQWIKAWNRKQT